MIAHLISLKKTLLDSETTSLGGVNLKRGICPLVKDTTKRLDSKAPSKSKISSLKE